jgi:hypothetical protein
MPFGVKKSCPFHILYECVKSSPYIYTQMFPEPGSGGHSLQ